MSLTQFLAWAFWEGFLPGALIGLAYGILAVGSILIVHRYRTGCWKLPGGPTALPRR